MKIHREGFKIIAITAVLCGGLYAVNHIYLIQHPNFFWAVNAVLFAVFFLVVQFFRIPPRNLFEADNAVVCPADGKVVVIEETEETEYFKDRRIQLSIFMSPLNVHAQWYPISGKTAYYKYHPGKYLVAWHPKSSTENERTTVVIKRDDGQEILVRQIAGAMARRIICYSQEGETVKTGGELGFIRFGSRVDVFFPLGSEIAVELEQKVIAQETVLGWLKSN